MNRLAIFHEKEVCWIENEREVGRFMYDVHDGTEWPSFFFFIRPDVECSSSPFL
jgi:hypothetical protein